MPYAIAPDVQTQRADADVAVAGFCQERSRVDAGCLRQRAAQTGERTTTCSTPLLGLLDVQTTACARRCHGPGSVVAASDEPRGSCARCSAPRRLHGAARGPSATRPAVAHGMVWTWTYAQLARRPPRAGAAGLAALGLRPGDRVGLFMANAPDYLAADVGRPGGPVRWWCRSTPACTACEAAWILQHAGAARCASVDAAHGGRTRAAPARGPACCWHDAAALLARRRRWPIRRPSAMKTMPAWLFYTSGTTGRPKGVTLTQRNLRLVEPGLHRHGCRRWRRAMPACTRRRCRMAAGIYHLPYVMNGGVNVIPASPTLDEAEVFALAVALAPRLVLRRAHDRQTPGRAHAAAHRPPLDGLATVVYRRRPDVPGRPGGRAAQRSARTWCRSTARARVR